ncbi:branched-chain amino acid transport system II carrier protein [Clostridium sp. MB40-C1]|uniref:branched-chain amino acid transport system II carrier protein n=1 Tax=Clostridium sp. MB40-C1 TaxID=3070996 RepID=UPI0027E011B0|nr:branched-chain amino acid transport system II carrier protein [Clostridium sp. MB40-C1]WMJ79169.1 branched-chain amino acid transport system II carrier protein [Clostridium sp. MB40-C1]
MNKKTKDTLILGTALFAMFFGAGNLIFPPSLGLLSGKDWIVCSVGFFLTAAGMPLLGIIAVSKAGGTINHISNKVNPTFSKIFAIVIILSIGPLLAIPRTGATTYEMGIKPIFPEISPLISSIIFFGITLYFVVKPSEIVDKIAKILTPLLLIMIFVIIIKGIISPLGSTVTKMDVNPFSKGFTEGYQTMDALASLLFGGVVLNSIISKGYESEKDHTNMTIKAGIIASLALGLVYGGLIYLGASTNSIFPPNKEKADLLITITNSLLGDFGKIALGIVVSLACLTTSIGLTATVGNYFSDLSNNKISYKYIVILTVIISTIFANVGLEKIVLLSIPLLVMVYPIAIVLILMNLFNKYIPNSAYKGAIIGAFIISLHDGASAAKINTSFFSTIINLLPLSKYGFAWIAPALLGGFISTFLLKNSNLSNEPPA